MIYPISNVYIKVYLSNMKKKMITLIGGSGFLAKYCISELLKAGHTLKIVCRNPHLAGHLRMMAPIEQLDIVKGNILLKNTIEPHIKKLMLLLILWAF